jgi:hypothetical protein
MTSKKWLAASIAICTLLISEVKTSAAGPDIIIGELRGDNDNPTSQPRTWGIAGAYIGYSVGHTECSIGNMPVDAYDGGTLHPVYNQSLYRYKSVAGAGQFEMIGHSWLMHEFCVLQGSVCGTCTPFCGGCCSELGVGCSDPHSANRSGARAGLGPKSQINAATGQILVWPYTPAPEDDVTTGRIRALTTGVDPALNAGATYYAEEQAVAQDDATAANKNNNASYRRCVLGGSPNFTMSWASTAPGQTIRQTQAIRAWGDNEHTVAFTDVDVPNDGRFTMGYNVTDLSGTGDGPWHYEYALHNMNSDRCADSFSVPMPYGVIVSNIQFHDVEYYKDGFNIGTAYDGKDWDVTLVPAASLAWNMVPATPYENSNALRWGTMYNFRFNADSPPVAGEVTLGLFKPGSPSSVSIAALIPSVIPCACPGDLNNSSTIDGEDIAPFTSMYTAQSPISNCADLAIPLSGPLDEADLGEFVDLLVNGPNICK